MRRAIFSGLVPAALVLLAWILGGINFLERGGWAVWVYITVLLAFLVGFIFEQEAQDAIATIRRERPPTAREIEVGQPSDKAKMREAVINGVLEVIKGLVARSEAAENEIKELKSRMSEVSLAAGLKPRVARAPEPRP